jgi:hypothetical protein
LLLPHLTVIKAVFMLLSPSVSIDLTRALGDSEDSGVQVEEPISRCRSISENSLLFSQGLQIFNGDIGTTM